MFGWKHTKNCDLWKLLEEEVLWWGDRLVIKHVYAHTKAVGWKAILNDRVDKLAKEGAMKTGMKEADDSRNYGDGNARNEGECVLYAERLKMCDKCKMPVNVCMCESVFAKRSYDSRNDRRKESL